MHCLRCGLSSGPVVPPPVMLAAMVSVAALLLEAQPMPLASAVASVRLICLAASWMELCDWPHASPGAKVWESRNRRSRKRTPMYPWRLHVSQRTRVQNPRFALRSKRAPTYCLYKEQLQTRLVFQRIMVAVTIPHGCGIQGTTAQRLNCNVV